MKDHFRIVVLLLTVSVFLSFSACQKGGRKPFGVTDIEFPDLEMSGRVHLPEETTLTDGEVMVAPLSEKMEKQIIADYLKYEKKNGGYDVEYTINRYYGCYNGLIPVFIDSSELEHTCDIGERLIAGCKFYFSSGSYNIEVWDNGDFYTLAEAYNEGLLTQKEIAMIHSVHGGLWRDPSDKYTAAKEALVELDQSLRKEIREAFHWEEDEKWWFNLHLPECLEQEAIRCYGKFGGGYVLLEPLSSKTNVIREIAGIEFDLSGSLWVYKEGRVYSLEDAYKKGTITQKQIETVALNHQTVEQYLLSEKSVEVFIPENS